MAFLPMDRLPVGQHSPHLWREHMHQMSRMGSMPTTQDYMPSVQIPDHAQTPLTMIVKNNTDSTIEAGMTRRAYCYVPPIPNKTYGEFRIGGAPQSSTTPFGKTVTAVHEVPAGGTGEFYCAGVYPARTHHPGPWPHRLYAWCDEDEQDEERLGELKNSYLGEFYVWSSPWYDLDEDGDPIRTWAMVENIRSMSTDAIGSPYPQIAQWSGAAKLVSGTVGGEYTWAAAKHTVGGDWAASTTLFDPLRSGNTATAQNLAEVDTDGHTCSVPTASIPAGWGPLPILGFVNMTVTFYQGDYRAWFCVQNQFSGACS